MAYTATLDSTNNLVTLAQAQSHLGISPGVAQVVQVNTLPENAGGGLGAKYWQISSTVDDYYVWYDTDNGSVDPAVSNRTGIEVDIANGDSATQVATKTAAAVTAVSGMTATSTNNLVTITNDAEGIVTAPSAGTSGFTVTEEIEGRDPDNEHDNLITDLINAVSWHFNSQCDRDIKSRSQTEYYDGNGGYTLYLNHPPVSSLTLYQDADRAWAASTAISSSDYSLYSTLGKVVLTGTAFLSDVYVIKATYTGGYSTIPYDIQEAALFLIAQNYRVVDQQVEHLSTRSNDGGSTTFSFETNPNITRVIAKYRRWGSIGG